MDNSILLNSSVSDEDPVSTFYNNNIPTVENFNQIKEDKLKAFKGVLAEVPEDDYLTHLVFTILKLSSIGSQSPEAKNIAQQLFKEAFEYGKNKDRVRTLGYFINSSIISNLSTDQKHQKLLPDPTRSPEVRGEKVPAKVQHRVVSIGPGQCHQGKLPARRREINI